MDTGVWGEREGVGGRYVRVPHLLVTGGECWKGVHLHPTSQAPGTKIPSPGPPRRHIQACYLLPEFHDGGRDVLGRVHGTGCGAVQEVHAMLCGGQGGIRSGSGRQRRPHILSPTLWPAGPIIPSPREPPLSSVRSSPSGSPVPSPNPAESDCSSGPPTGHL